ncbi:hypothetical protein BC938DRAFT_474877, partial [Jimgerdemannia flammicorona]
MPTRTEPVSILLGADPDPTSLPICGSCSLSAIIIITLFWDHSTQSSTLAEPRVPHRTGYILNTGGSIWAMDWCPKFATDDPDTQYLAVGGYAGTTDEHHPIGERLAGKGMVQVWRVDTRIGGPAPDEEKGPTLELCIVHEYGCAYDIKWCPYGTYEASRLHPSMNRPSNLPPSRSISIPTITTHFPWAILQPDTLVLDTGSLRDTVPKLGVLAVAFGDGVVRMFAVPHPRAMRRW